MRRGEKGRKVSQAEAAHKKTVIHTVKLDTGQATRTDTSQWAHGGGQVRLKCVPRSKRPDSQWKNESDMLTARCCQEAKQPSSIYSTLVSRVWMYLEPVFVNPMDPCVSALHICNTCRFKRGPTHTHGSDSLAPCKPNDWSLFVHRDVKWLSSRCIISARPDLLVLGRILINQRTPHGGWLSRRNGNVRCESSSGNVCDIFAKRTLLDWGNLNLNLCTSILLWLHT